MFSGGIKRDKWDEMGYVFSFSSPITSPNENTSKQPELLWRRGVLVITTEKLHFTKPILRFCPGSNVALVVLEVCDGENL